MRFRHRVSERLELAYPWLLLILCVAAVVFFAVR